MAEQQQPASLVPLSELARERYDDERVALVANTVASGATRAQLAMFLEVAARYDLDPFLKEIWCVVPRDGDGMPKTDKVLIFTGRDGFLKIANRSADFRGIEGDVVHEKDVFKVRRLKDGTREVEHEFEGGTEARGKILGAWAYVHREGRTSTFFYAPFEEYVPKNDAKLKWSPWGSTVSAMMLKVAYVNALRLAFSISGLYVEEELQAVLAADRATAGDLSGDDVEWGDDPILAQHLEALFVTANEKRPDKFRPAKIKQMLAGKTQGEREALAQDIEEMIRGWGVKVPVRPEPEPAEEVDAEVVPASAEA